MKQLQVLNDLITMTTRDNALEAEIRRAKARAEYHLDQSVNAILWTGSAEDAIRHGDERDRALAQVAELEAERERLHQEGGAAL